MFKIVDFLISPENYDVIMNWGLVTSGIATATVLGVLWIPVILKYC
jgi:hypothetical protein